jgi:energy-coupling factor transport system ATP-binding protein
LSAAITEGASNAIEIRNLSFNWPSGTPVLRDCSLELPKGELWMLLGTNGSGKSTLLRLIAGLFQPQTGSIQVDGKIGFVLQNPDHQLVMPTVGADVAFGLVGEHLSYPEVRQRVHESLLAVNLDHLVRRPIYALSGGQKQRVAIAGTIAQHSDVLLFDEPTALLDPDAQIDLVAQVRDLVKSRHLAALWVTHRLEELDYCDGAFLLENGKLVDRGDPQRLRQRLVSE